MVRALCTPLTVVMLGKTCVYEYGIMKLRVPPTNRQFIYATAAREGATNLFIDFYNKTGYINQDDLCSCFLYARLDLVRWQAKEGFATIALDHEPSDPPSDEESASDDTDGRCTDGAACATGQSGSIEMAQCLFTELMPSILSIPSVNRQITFGAVYRNHIPLIAWLKSHSRFDPKGVWWAFHICDYEWNVPMLDTLYPMHYVFWNRDKVRRRMAHIWPATEKKTPEVEAWLRAHNYLG